MDTKTPIAGSSKSVENTTENNIKNNINTMTERELNNMLFKGVDPKKETKETLSQLVRWRIQEYEQHNWRRYLSEIFAEEFVQFVKEDFDTLDKQILDSLRDCLRANGVYVPKRRGIAASQALADVVQEDIPWPEDDEEPAPATAAPAPIAAAPASATAASAPVASAPAPAAAPASAAAQGYPHQQAQQQQPHITSITQLPGPHQTPGPNQPPGPNQLPPAPIYGPAHRIPHLLPSPHQIIQDFGIKQNHGHSKELNGLLKKGVVEISDKQDVPAGTRIFDSRFVDQVKNEGTEKAFEKSRLVVQALNDPGKYEILTQAPTIQRASQRLIIALSLTIPDISLYARDITQAYTQSRSQLARDVFILASVEMRLSMGTALRTYHKLYGITMSDTYLRIQLT